MSKWVRFALGMVAFIVLICVFGWLIFTYTIGAMGTPTCSNHRVWKVGEYDIVEKQCLGFAGPHYYPVYLFKGGVEISMITYLEDSCEASSVRLIIEQYQLIAEVEVSGCVGILRKGLLNGHFLEEGKGQDL